MTVTAKEAGKHFAIVREHGEVVTQQWRDGGRIRCGEDKVDEASGNGLEDGSGCRR